MKNRIVRSLLFLFLCPVLLFAEKTVCLTLVVQNDETTIWHCLSSAEKIADCISICDMGSTDKTIDFVELFFRGSGIPGKIHRIEPQKYGFNKKIVAQTARETLQNLGFSLKNTYLLMMEPDQQLQDESLIRKNALDQDAYLVLNQSYNLAYSFYQPNLFRASLDPEKIGSLLEPNSNKEMRAFAKFRTLRIEDQSFPFGKDEGEEDVSYERRLEMRKKEKLDRKIELLNELLDENPTDGRALLTLAQARKTLGQYFDAVSCYQDRIRLGGNPEEIWLSKYMLGECYEAMNDWKEALYWYLDAFQTNPHRAESLRKIATYYRVQGQNNLSYLFAKHGWRVPYPGNGELFPLPPLSDYQFDEEISIAAFYTGYKDEGYQSSSDLLLRRDTPPHVRKQGYANLLFYVQNLKARHEWIKIPLPPIDKDPSQCYSPMNPSMQKTKDGYKLICRAVNYTQSGAKHFHTVDPEGVFRTKNFLIQYDKNFKRLSQQEIIEELPRQKYPSFLVQGLEDCRLTALDNATWFTCTSFDTNPTGALQIVLCKIEEKGWQGPIRVEKWIPLQGPDPNRHEKNWLPFMKDGDLHIIYSSDPFIVYKPNFSNGESDTVIEYQDEHDFSSFRGSAAPIEFDNGYLMLIHEVVFMPDYTRCYVHRFVYLDRDFKVKSLSKPFTFLHSGVEFCLSMTIDHEGKELVMPIGIEDREAVLTFVDLDEVRSLLKPLPPVYANH